ncbi:MAG: DeoR/GlpR transcriptional regulator [Dactylosporangium sp.]|nr:DeoR/GlpR transcriptional regulator [Dactylosporangium sp.]
MAAELGCSAMTIRRDLDALAELGAVKRVRGGAVSMLTGEETPYAARTHLAAAGKRAIAEIATSMIEEGETVIVDSGTTAFEVALRLVGHRGTVMPLSMHAAVALGQGPHLKLIMPGGEVRHGEQTLIGPLAEHAFTQLRFDTMVLSCCGLDPRHGLTAHDLTDASVKRAAAAASRRVIAVADATKLGKVAFARICPLGQVSLLVTDAPADDPAVVELTTAGLTVRSAGQKHPEPEKRPEPEERPEPEDA